MHAAYEIVTRFDGECAVGSLLIGRASAIENPAILSSSM